MFDDGRPRPTPAWRAVGATLMAAALTIKKSRCGNACNLPIRAMQSAAAENPSIATPMATKAKGYHCATESRRTRVTSSKSVAPAIQASEKPS